MTQETRMTFTAGSWHARPVEDFERDMEGAGNINIMPDSGFIVAKVYRTPAENAEANARLIVAALDLLTELQEFVSWADDCEHLFETLQTDEGWRMCVEGARAAITKALGHD